MTDDLVKSHETDGKVIRLRRTRCKARDRRASRKPQLVGGAKGSDRKTGIFTGLRSTAVRQNPSP